MTRFRSELLAGRISQGWSKLSEASSEGLSQNSVSEHVWKWMKRSQE